MLISTPQDVLIWESPGSRLAIVTVVKGAISISYEIAVIARNCATTAAYKLPVEEFGALINVVVKTTKITTAKAAAIRILGEDKFLKNSRMPANRNFFSSNRS